MKSDKQVALITGANRGIGLEVTRQLAAKDYRTILTARNEETGATAAASLRAQQLDVEFHVLDVRDETSIDRLRQHIIDTFGRLDVLVNNAGIFPDPATDSPAASVFKAELDTIRTAFDTNTLAALRLCQVLIPLMEGQGRVVNVSSGMGQLTEMNGGCPAYRLSKTALNAVTRIFADELHGSDIKINSICPGWVKTDMGGPNAELTVAEGAKGIVWAATLPADGPSGGFFRHGKPIPW